ncbi:MAG: glutamine amidotransferase [Deltaproteobacteria bacterium]|nr:glutamine amidotransferase [Deltaproteobacteria bacterium]
MCGIAGIIAPGSQTLAVDLVEMLKHLEHRGRDATGVAFYELRDSLAIRVSLRNLASEDHLEKIISGYAKIVDPVTYTGEGIFTFYEAKLDMDPARLAELNWAVDSDPNLCIHSLGPRLTIYKDEGSAEDLARRHHIKAGPCTHGIGHVRMATESVENIDFAHPFTSYLLPDLALVHNGQFTNYFNMRRLMETRGIRFKTNNDSEMAAHYLAWEMTHNGLSMEEAMTKALDDMDGIFTIIATTTDQMGAFRDRLGIKPVLFYEADDGTVLLGSEQIALTPIFDDIYATEMEPGGVKVWSV